MDKQFGIKHNTWLIYALFWFGCTITFFGFSIASKTFAGTNPFDVRGLVIPLSVGSLVGLIMGWGFLKIHNINFLLQRKVEKRTAELESVNQNNNYKINRLERIKQELKSSERQYRTLFENAIDCIFITQGEVIKMANPSTVKLIGYSEKELAEMPFINLIHPEDRDLVMDKHVRRLSGEDEYSKYSHRAINMSGEVLWVEVHGVRIDWDSRPASLIFVRDITERKQMEEALRKSEEKYRELVEITDDLIGQVDKDGRIVYVNGKSEKFFGLSNSDCIGKSIFDFIYFEDKERTTAAFNEWVDKRISSTTFENRQVNKVTGKIHDLHWTINLLYEYDGTLKAVNSIARDITERKMVEKEREKLLNHLQEAMAEIKTLRGILPVCSFCKKIRDDKGYWERVDVYLQEHTEADISHSICPECAKKHYPNVRFRE